MGKVRIRAAEAWVARQHCLRNALTEIGNAACFTTDRLAILKLAETMAPQVGDDGLIGSMSPGPLGQFSATFESATALPRDDLTNDFLDDLCRIVSVAAERLHLADNLREEALTDPLTRLPNRKALELHLAKAFERAGRNGTRLALLSCDIDDFKRENDKYGHAWGDELLLRMAGRLWEILIEACQLELADAPGHGSVTVGVAELRADDSLESLVARADRSALP